MSEDTKQEEGKPEKINRVSLLQTLAAMSQILQLPFDWKDASKKTNEEVSAQIDSLQDAVNAALASNVPAPLEIGPARATAAIPEPEVTEPLIILSKQRKHSHTMTPLVADERDFQFSGRIVHLNWPSIEVAFDPTLFMCWHSKYSGHFNPTQLSARFPNPDNPEEILSGRAGILKIIYKWARRQEQDRPGSFEIITEARFEALKNRVLNAKMLEDLNEEAQKDPDGYAEFLATARELHSKIPKATTTNVSSGPVTVANA